MYNILYSLPSDIKDYILDIKSKIEFKSVLHELQTCHSECKLLYSINVNNNNPIYNELKTNILRKKANKCYYSTFNRFNTLQTTIEYNLRSPFCYGWVISLKYLTLIELQIICEMNDIKPIGSHTQLIKKLLNI